jgi:hypothetical protein
MADVGKTSKIIRVTNVDGSLGRLDVASCKSVRVNHRERYSSASYLYKTPNKRWYLEERNLSNGESRWSEITLDKAMNILIDCNFNTTTLEKFGCLDYIPDVTQSPTPAHGGDVVIKCLACCKSQRDKNLALNKKDKQILSAISRAKWPLVGKEIAALASLKYDSYFRTLLRRLVVVKQIVKVYGKQGYILASKQKS